MAIFRKSRRQRPVAASQPSPEAGEPRPAPPGEALREALSAIAAGASAPEEALEPALRAIIDASRAQAAAVCVFDPRHAILRLVAEVGLSDEGCRRLRSVRRGDPTAWDMPLHGLLNRRAYLIESASRNRYVPRLVENAGTVRSIACLPLYAGPVPIGSLVLIAVAPRSFGERDIRLLERGVGELAAMIETVRRRGGVVDAPEPASRPAQHAVDVSELVAERESLRGEMAARLAERACLAAEVTARTGEAERLRAALDAAAAERARVTEQLERAHRDAERIAGLAAALEAADRDRERLAAALEAAAAERAGQARNEVALEEARAAAERTATAAAVEVEAARRATVLAETQAAARTEELTEEIARLTARVEQAEAAIGRERAIARERDHERERLAYELRAATEREQRLREDLEAASGRTAPGSEEALRHALETVRRAEEARATAAAEAEAAHAALASTQEVVLALEEEAARANAEIERLGAAARTVGGEHDRLEIALAEGRARELAATARVAELVRDNDAFRREQARVTAGMREFEARMATLVARLEAVAAERDRLRAALDAAAAERDRLKANAGEAAASQTSLGESLARESAERARLTAALATAQAALGELETTLARREAEAREQAAEIERLRAEHASLVPERSARGAEAPAPREPVRVITVAPTFATRARTRDVDAGRGPIVAVLDIDEAWGGVRVDGHQVAVLSPGDDLAEQIPALTPGRIVVNLAAPGALAALTRLRLAGSEARFWGCIADPRADRALPLGMVEPATAPLDPEAIAAALGRYAVRGTRVVTAGADVDGLMSLRQALARRGMSVSMAWDGKQASELLLVVRPEVVVVDLGLQRRDGYAILARLGTVDPVPSAVVVPAADDVTTAFAATLADAEHGGRLLRLGQLLAAIVTRSEAPPAEKRPHKVRVMGRK